MPYRRKRSRSRRRRYKPRFKRRRRRSKRPVNPVSLQMPKKFFAKLRYSELVRLDATAGTPDTYVFRANDLFDPNLTGTGHQPRAFDELIALYDHFVVYASKCSCVVTPIDPSEPYDVSLVGTDTSSAITSTFTNISNVYEHKNRRMKTFTPSINVKPSYMSLGFSAKKHLGRSKPLADPELKGSNAAGPTEQWYYQVSQIPHLVTENPGPVDVLVTIDYLICFIEYVTPPES